MEKIKKVREWIREIVPYGKVQDYIVESKDEQGPDQSEPSKDWEHTYHAKFYTDKHKYYFVAVERQDGRNYLGAQAQLRKPRAGEDWTRGSDLPDGKLNRKTWECIKNAIIRYEMVILSDYVRDPPDHTAEADVEERKEEPSLGDEKNG